MIWVEAGDGRIHRRPLCGVNLNIMLNFDLGLRTCALHHGSSYVLRILTSSIWMLSNEDGVEKLNDIQEPAEYLLTFDSVTDSTRFR